MSHNPHTAVTNIHIAEARARVEQEMANAAKAIQQADRKVVAAERYASRVTAADRQ